MTTAPLTPLTAEELAALKTMAEEGPWFTIDSPLVSRLLVQVQEAEARWDALKAGVDEIHAHWSSFHSVCPSAVASVQKLIERLEREPPTAREAQS